MAKRIAKLPPGIRYTTDSAGRERFAVRVKYRRPDGTLADVPRMLEVGASLGDAKALMRKLLAEAEAGTVKPLRQRQRAGVTVADPTVPLTLAQAVERYLTFSKNVRRNRNIVKKTRLAKALASALGEKLPLSALTKERLVAYRDARLADGRAAATVNNEVRLLQHLMKVAADEGWPGASDELAYRVGRVKHVSGEGRRDRACTTAEVRLLVDRSKYPPRLADLWPVVFVALHCAARAGELRTLTAQQVDLDAGTITWRVTKNGKADIKPIHPAALPVLRDAIKRSPSAYVFPNYTTKDARRSGQAPYIDTRLSRLFIDLVAALGIPPDANGEPVVFHTLRHTSLTLLDEHTLDRGAASDLANHSDAITTRRYLHTRVERTRKALESLPDLRTLGDAPAGSALH